ncbi:MAG: hypothetical protein WBD12_01360, partial [Candidatus Omnitrophota bacterium]
MVLWLPQQWGSKIIRYCLSIFLVALIGIFLGGATAFPISVPGQISDIFTESGSIEEMGRFDGSRYVVYVASTEGKTDGYAVLAKERGKSGDITLIVVISPEYLIENIIVHRHMERKGDHI